jgi:hypothetical protein
VDSRDPGNDYALTADEAQAWKAIERSLRLRARYRYRLAAMTGRLTAEPLVLVGLGMLIAGGALVAAALLPATAALAAATSISVVGVGLLAFGLLRAFRPRRATAAAEAPVPATRIARTARLRSWPPSMRFRRSRA